MRRRNENLQARLLCGAAAAALLFGTPVMAQEASAKFNIGAQSLADGLNEFARQSGRPVMFTPEVAGSRMTRGVSDVSDPELALNMVLADTGLVWRRSGDTYLIVRAGDPQSGSAAGDGADGTVDALIVTAQKREEDIQDVPIAISAFTQEDLTRSQVAGGPDLITQVPNMTFTKTNFSSYSIQIRGIGTQAISATTDAAVAVAFNNTSFIRNRFFEQEFYDLARVEVLRGPQGTLYGRNATAGVVNIVSAKPKFDFGAKLSADVSNFNSTRLEGMVNIPLIEDAVALRIAAAWTKRDGFVTNEITGNPIDGRDLWSTRVSLRATPNDAVELNLIWEHFEEDDDRLRSAKQLCKTDEVTEVAGFPTTHFQTLPEYGQSLLFAGVQGSFSQACAPASLYSPESFGTPNGIALPYYLPLGAIFLPTALEDPYISRTQSHDLRVIESTVDPEYRATNDLGELQVSIDIADGLTVTSETAYLADDLFSLEDYNRFNTAPGAWRQPTGGFGDRVGVLEPGPNGGVFCDPQLGCTDRLVAVDVSSAKSRQFSQELRLSSDYDGPFNFSVGGNFLRYDTEDKYYVFINSLSIIAAISPFNTGLLPPYFLGDDNHGCLTHGPIPPDFSKPAPVAECTYIDPNPIGSLNDQGHNYFLSRNPYKLISYAAFGEAYYNVTDNLKITAGLRWTVDKKEAPRIPSWVLGSNSVGYPVTETVQQKWTEPTGRLAVDWKPDLSFTDETLLYASYAHGYKAGGANPPPMGVVCYSCGTDAQGAVEKSATHPKTFEPEFVNAFELGAKNVLFDGRLTVNTAAFYYDYTGYQISQIVNRSAVNLNFDADVLGLEIEADWRPWENFRLGFKGGYEDTKVADGMKAVDLMDRTAGRRGWVVYKPFPTFPSNCVLPEWLFIGNPAGAFSNPQLVNVGGRGGGNPGGCELSYVMNWDPVTNAPYEADPDFPFYRQGVNYADWSTDLADYPGWPTGVPITNGMDYPGWDPTIDYGNNNGEGFDKDLSGNELPNAPHFTATITTDWSLPLPHDWLMTLHGDFYYQSEAWTRIFNMEGYDKLKAYTNINLALLLNNEEAGWHVMAYVKNVLDRDSITGSFLNSDDTGLTTNIFLTEPRLYGLRVTKDWTGGSWWPVAGHPNGEPYAVTVEVSGQVQRHDGAYDPVQPGFIGDFAPTLDSAPDQNQDLDWGDGREIKLTYAMPNAWRVAGALRTGEANGFNRFLRYEVGDSGCLFGTYYCRVIEVNNYTHGTVSDHEEHQIIDFSVGRDVALGGLSSSAVSIGLRYAELESRTRLETVGIPDWQIPGENFWSSPGQHHRYETELDAQREFKGTGPTITWEGSQKLLGSAVSHLDVDWAASGGVLFGKQRTFKEGEERAAYFDGTKYYNYAWTNQVGPTVVTPVSESRSRSVTVPVAAVSLGLSYQVDRLKLGAGYRWERYFDVLDTGDARQDDADRTIDGPYFKLSMGFGG